MMKKLISNKYLFYTKPNDYKIFCDRGDQKEWMIFDNGCKAILSLLYTIEDKENEIKELGEIINELLKFKKQE